VIWARISEGRHALESTEAMRKSLADRSEESFEFESHTRATQSREILIPHSPTVTPLTAVKNVFIQSSLAGLKANGYWDRYVRLIDPAVLAQLESSMGPGWIPLELVTPHYEACDGLALRTQELNQIGSQVGHRLQEAVLVSSAKRERAVDFDMWAVMLSLHRMWARLYQGGSVQVVKLGPREKLIETRGYSLFQFHYYRQTSLAAFGAAYSALGAQVTSVKIQSYNPKTHEMVVRTSW
jgi:hypothetical protein